MAMDYDEQVFRPPGLPPRKERAYSEDGVDLTQIRRLLALSPGERLRELEECQADLEAVQLSHRRCNSGES